MSVERREIRGLVPALTAGAVVWTVSAVRRSLWIDEFHALHHARRDTFPEFLASLETGNHPPLSFLLLRIARGLFGDSHLAMRCWSIAVGLVAIVLTWRLARRLPDAASRAVAPWLVVLSGFSLTIFSEARMYGLLAVAVLGLVQTILGTLEGETRGWWLALWVPLGLYSHYYFWHYGLVLALALVVAIAVRSELRRGFARLIPPTLVGFALFLPWGLTGFLGQLEHGLPSGGSSGLYASLVGYVQSLAHLLFMRTSVAGEWLTYGFALPGSAVAALLGALGIARLFRSRNEGSGLLLLLLLVAGVLVPAWALLFSTVMPRSGYNWRYIAGSCIPVLLLIAAGVSFRPRARLLLFAVLAATLAVATAVLSVLPGREDYRGAVEYILRNARPGDAVLTYSTRWGDEDAPTGWDYYLEHADRPETLARGAEPVEVRLPPYRPVLEYDRVWLFIRSRFPADVLADLERGYDTHEVFPVSQAMTLHLFARR